MLIGVINRQSFGWTIHVTIPLKTILEAVLVACVTGLVAGYLPARWATRGPVVDGLRYERFNRFQANTSHHAQITVLTPSCSTRHHPNSDGRSLTPNGYLNQPIILSEIPSEEAEPPYPMQVR